MHTFHDIFTIQQVVNVNALCMVVVWGMETGLGPSACVRIHARVSTKYKALILLFSIYRNHIAYQVQFMYLHDVILQGDYLGSKSVTIQNFW